MLYEISVNQALNAFLFDVENESKKQRYLVMGKRISTSNGKNVKLVPTFIHPWVRSKVSYEYFLRFYLSMEKENNEILDLFSIHNIFAIGNEKSSTNVQTNRLR